jgi:hypothetical protein
MSTGKEQTIKETLSFSSSMKEQGLERNRYFLKK